MMHIVGPSLMGSIRGGRNGDTYSQIGMKTQGVPIHGIVPKKGGINDTRSESKQNVPSVGKVDGSDKGDRAREIFESRGEK